MEKLTTRQRAKRNLLTSIVKHPYSWPGGYMRCLATEDGALLCCDCVRSEAKRIMTEIRDDCDPAWIPAAHTYEAISPEHSKEVDETLVGYCGHCNKEIGELGC